MYNSLGLLNRKFPEIILGYLNYLGKNTDLPLVLTLDALPSLLLALEIKDWSKKEILRMYSKFMRIEHTCTSRS